MCFCDTRDIVVACVVFICPFSPVLDTSSPGPQVVPVWGRPRDKLIAALPVLELHPQLLVLPRQKSLESLDCFLPLLPLPATRAKRVAEEVALVFRI